MSETWKQSSEFSVELLADYVEGLVDQATAARITDHLANHQEDAEVVGGIAAFLSSTAGDREGLEDWLARTLPTQQAQHAERKAAPTRTLWPRYAAVAASVALLALAIGWWLTRTTSPQSPAEWQQFAMANLEETYPSPTTVRSGETLATLDSLKSAAAQAYDQKQWDQAAHTYTSLLQKYPAEAGSTERFYLALANVYGKNIDAGTESLLQQLSEGESAYAAPARYYHILLTLQKGEVETAQEMARNALEQSSVYQEKVLRQIAE